MQQLAGALGYGGQITTSVVGERSQSSRHQAPTSSAQHHSQQPTVLISSEPPSAELTSRMYSDLVASLVWARDSAERRAENAEARLHALNSIIAATPGVTRVVRATSPVPEEDR